jgi:hypothetical protein
MQLFQLANILQNSLYQIHEVTAFFAFNKFANEFFVFVFIHWAINITIITLIVTRLKIGFMKNQLNLSEIIGAEASKNE